MNSVSAKYQNKVIVEISTFEFELDECNISLNIQSDNLEINVKGLKGTEILEKLLADVESLLFIFLGSFPAILSLCINGNERDLSGRVNKFNTSSQFVKKNLVLYPINLETFNSDKINKMRRDKQTPMFSLQYVVSESYEAVVQDHKITLLLHLAQAFVDEQYIKKDKEEARNKFSIPEKDRIGDYFAASYHLCQNHFFKYDSEYNCEVLQILNISQYDFLRIMTNTRNWYSHFYNESETPLRLDNGAEMRIYFEIIYYAIRLMIMDNLDVRPKEESIREFYFSVHDWIAGIYKRDVPLKSIAYTTIAMIEKLNNK